MKSLLQESRRLVLESGRVYWTLLKVMVPALLVVKALDMLGGVTLFGHVLSPLMQWVGLPDEVGIVWATLILTNIYAGMLVFFNLGLSESLTVAQVTVLGVLMLLSHALPVEGAIAKRMGVSWRVTIALRFGGALVLGCLLHQFYSHFDLLQQPSQLMWQPPAHSDSGVWGWCLTQLETLMWIYVIILALMSLLKMLRVLGVERLIHALLYPILRMLGIGKSAANVAVIGTVLGLTFGAGLLIKEAEAGHLSKRDIFLTIGFLSLCHSVIEDTMLVLLLGADLSGVLWARLGFALIVIAVLARLPFVTKRLASAH
ncbi:hypothetical protein MAQ5080_01712 [Marinomonas aquimarina]|uniref:Nucleoside recognition n=1 Tax=Marinomonas aquimarina TaxID=295068 RepID=A0A1A8TEQ2_9GAMM|nr:hypothetical protein [Marinomonas aquimarina]SBS30570.1 hypothetical protein MAQ5080_01712 [Marinomonas aquimarina]